MTSTFLSSLLALSALLLGLSVLVQTIQEIYKYLSNNKSRAYSNAMRDYMGSVFSQIMKSAVVQNTRAKGPLQVFRYRPKSHTMPLSTQQLERALTTTLSVVKKNALKALTAEEKLQKGKASKPSAEWTNFLDGISRIPLNTQSGYSAADLVTFLKDWDHVFEPQSFEVSERSVPLVGNISFSVEEEKMDASRMLTAFRLRFMHDQIYYVENYADFNESFYYQYKRRNMRMSFIIALLMTLTCNLSIQEVYKSATSLSEKEAAELYGAVTNAQQTLLDLSGNQRQTTETEMMSQSRTERRSSGSSVALPGSQPLATADEVIPSTVSAMQNDSNNVGSAHNTQPHVSDNIISEHSATDTNLVRTSHSHNAVDESLKIEKLIATSEDLVSSMKKATDKGTELFNVEVAMLYLKSLYGSAEAGSAGVTATKGWLYVLGCFVTAVFVSFGAPILNDAAGALFKLRSSPAAAKSDGGKDGDV